MLELIPPVAAPTRATFALRTVCARPENAAFIFPTRILTSCRSPPCKENWSLISDEEKWKRTEENREKLGRGCRASTAASNPINKDQTWRSKNRSFRLFSLEERDRRWNLLRQEMRTADLHALISLPNEGHWDQFGADTRYITQIGGTQTEVGAVLPAEDEVTAIVRGANEIEWWGLAQDWSKTSARRVALMASRSSSVSRKSTPSASASSASPASCAHPRNRALGNLRKDPRRASYRHV